MSLSLCVIVEIETRRLVCACASVCVFIFTSKMSGDAETCVLVSVRACSLSEKDRGTRLIKGNCIINNGSKTKTLLSSEVRLREGQARGRVWCMCVHVCGYSTCCVYVSRVGRKSGCSPYLVFFSCFALRVSIRENNRNRIPRYCSRVNKKYDVRIRRCNFRLGTECGEFPACCLRYLFVFDPSWML